MGWWGVLNGRVMGARCGENDELFEKSKVE